jgi:hypothetical protein
MPIGHLRTLTNMGCELKEDDSWKVYEHEVKPADPTMYDLHGTKPAGRIPPQEIQKPKKGRKPVPKSKREAKVEEAIEKDLKKRNIRKPKDNNDRPTKRTRKSPSVEPEQATEPSQS